MRLSTYGLFGTMCIYMSVAVICLFMFGDEMESSVLINIGEARNSADKEYWEAYMVQVAFMIVLVCHIPFIFFAGKEGLLIIIDELARQSISSALWHKTQACAPNFAERFGTDLPTNVDLPIPGDDEAYSSVIKLD